MKKVLLCLSIFSQVLLVGLLGFIIYCNNCKSEIISGLFDEKIDLKDKISQENTVPYKKYIEAKGRVVPSEGYIEAYSYSPGFIDKVFVSIGDDVKKGQPIVGFNNTEIQIEIKEKEANLNKAKAILAFNKKEPCKYALLSKKREIEQLEIQQKGQKQQAFILNNLFSQAALTPFEYEGKKIFIEKTNKELEKAFAEYEGLKKGISREEEQVYLSDVEEKKAQLKLSQRKLEHSVIKAPINGCVVGFNLSEKGYPKKQRMRSVILAEKTPSMIKVSVSEYDAYKIAVNKNLRAVAVHPANHNIVFPLEYVSFEPKLAVYKNGEKKLHLYFSFKKNNVPVYFEQTFNIYLETSYIQENTFLDRKL